MLPTSSVFSLPISLSTSVSLYLPASVCLITSLFFISLSFPSSSSIIPLLLSLFPLPHLSYLLYPLYLLYPRPISPPHISLSPLFPTPPLPFSVSIPPPLFSIYCLIKIVFLQKKKYMDHTNFIDFQ